jgi:hypothetical protein
MDIARNKINKSFIKLVKILLTDDEFKEEYERNGLDCIFRSNLHFISYKN